jgi:hypothetical protein
MVALSALGGAREELMGAAGSSRTDTWWRINDCRSVVALDALVWLFIQLI